MNRQSALALGFRRLTAVLQLLPLTAKSAADDSPTC